MIATVGFQTRARTIDHLGRGQIADAPTAISELWKNAYDAYATNVALHIFDGAPEVGAIFDDGFGMDRADLVNRWLVIGTELKIEEEGAAPPETFGLPSRQRQGEKGIGRLSAAFLGPSTILISKKMGAPFVSVVVDWRLFENPFIALEDVLLPIGEYRDGEGLIAGIGQAGSTIRSNLGSAKDGRGQRLKQGWNRFSDYERRQGATQTTAEAIEAAWGSFPLDRRHLNEWPVFLGLTDHGTAMFLPWVNHELAVWVQPDAAGPEVDEVKGRLRETLTGFTDPYADPRPEFDYEVLVHQRGVTARVLAASDVFGLEGLRSLEHHIEGSFDERGVFRGQVTAFDQDLGIKEYVPHRPPPLRGRDRLGPFALCVGTFEVDERRSTHSEQQHAILADQAEHFGGIAVYRDGLRVMPYGRPDADFLQLEERRSRHAGRYFWAHRRTFGRIAFTRDDNPALRDKAGREGLVENQANREMRILVKELLVEFASRYFGTDSALRRELLPAIMARKAAQREAANQARTRRRRTIRQFLREQAAELDTALKRAEALLSLAQKTQESQDRVQATALAARANELRLVGDNLRPPATAPSRLGDLEDQWRSYRDDYQDLTEKLEQIARLTAEVEARFGGASADEVVRRHFSDQQTALIAQIDAYAAEIDSRMDALRNVWRDHERQDRSEFERRVGHVLEGVVSTLIPILNLLDVHRSELSDTFANRYPPFLNTLNQLVEGLDLEGAYAVTEDDRAELEQQLRDLRAVAQVGVTVEIIGHEFETLELEVRRNLSRLPAACRQHQAYMQALRAHQALADRFRFLSPMKIGGYRSREQITGTQISDYVEEFFSRTFEDRRITFTGSSDFRRMFIMDIPSRIHPVFLNLVNNAVYWVSQVENREIRFDFRENLAIVADSGPGVDPDDVPRLFELFFTKRRGGRGVGLYLSRANLAVAGHKIRYATPHDPKVLSGANFIIEFRNVGLRDAG